jgi:hypothetical protein
VCPQVEAEEGGCSGRSCVRPRRRGGHACRGCGDPRGGREVPQQPRPSRKSPTDGRGARLVQAGLGEGGGGAAATAAGPGGRAALCRSSSWRTPAMMTGTGRHRRRHASATLGKGPAVGPPARAASRRCHPRMAVTPAMTTATTRRSTTISACRTLFYSFFIYYMYANFEFLYEFSEKLTN